MVIRVAALLAWQTDVCQNRNTKNKEFYETCCECALYLCYCAWMLLYLTILFVYQLLAMSLRDSAIIWKHAILLGVWTKFSLVLIDLVITIGSYIVFIEKMLKKGKAIMKSYS